MKRPSMSGMSDMSMKRRAGSRAWQKGLPRAATLAGAALLGACATNDVPSVANMLSDTTGQDGRACVRTSDIQSYGVLENDVLSVNAQQDYYLMTVLPGCNDIRGSMAVAFGGDFHEICGQSMDRITTQDGYCTIGQVYEFESREEAFATYNQIVEKREALKEAAQGGD